MATTTARRRQTQSMRPYTKAEINTMIDESEAEFAAGGGIDDEDLRREDEEEYERELAEELSDMDKELYTSEEAYEMTMKDIKAIYDEKDAI